MGKILVIDDEMLFCKALKRLLEAFGYEVITAYNGKEGIRQVEQEKPGLVITDITMPEKDGLEVILELQKNNPALPVIAISGNRFGEGYLQTAIDFGACSILSKPFDNEQLIELIKKYI